MSGNQQHQQQREEAGHKSSDNKPAVSPADQHPTGRRSPIDESICETSYERRELRGGFEQQLLDTHRFNIGSPTASPAVQSAKPNPAAVPPLK